MIIKDKIFWKLNNFAQEFYYKEGYSVNNIFFLLNGGQIYVTLYLIAIFFLLKALLRHLKKSSH